MTMTKGMKRCFAVAGVLMQVTRAGDLTDDRYLSDKGPHSISKSDSPLARNLISKGETSRDADVFGSASKPISYGTSELQSSAVLKTLPKGWQSNKKEVDDKKLRQSLITDGHDSDNSFPTSENSFQLAEPTHEVPDNKNKNNTKPQQAAIILHEHNYSTFSGFFRFYDSDDMRLVWITLVLSCIFALVNAGTQVLFVVYAIDSVAEDDTDAIVDSLVRVTWIFACTIPFAYIICTVGTYCARLAAERAGKRVRLAYFKSLIRQDIQWYDEQNSAAGLPAIMEAQLNQYLKATGNLFIHAMILANGLVLIGIAIAWNLEISGLLLIFYPFVFLSLFGYGEFRAKSGKLIEKSYEQAAAVVEENLHNLKTVAAFGGEQGAVDRYSSLLDSARIEVWRNVSVTQIYVGLSGLFTMCFALGVWWAGTRQFPNNTLNPLTGDPYVLQDVITPVLSLIFCILVAREGADGVQALREGQIAAASMYKIIDTQPVIEKIDNGHSSNLVPFDNRLRKVNEIQFQDVRFSYPSRPDIQVLKGINFRIKAGQKVAIVGESGSGKSTIIQLLERFYDPVGTAQHPPGKVTVNGMNLAEVPIFSWRAVIGYVGQEPALTSTTILENIRLGDPSASDADVMRAAKMARVHEFIDSLTDQYETHVGVGGILLSGGQKQRVAIARALIKKPKILLLDEATSALDNESEKMVQATIDGLQSSGADKHNDLIVITVAHRLSTIRASDKIFFLSVGQVVEEGTHEELMALRGGYYSLVETQEAVSQLNAQDTNTTSQDTHKKEEQYDRRLSVASSNANSIALDATSDNRFLSGGVEQVDPAEIHTVTRAFIKKRLLLEGIDLTEGNIEKERRKIILEECKYKVPHNRIFFFSEKENVWFPLMFLACLGAGVFEPMLGFLLGKSIDALSYCEPFRDSDNYIPEDSICLDYLDETREVSKWAAINAAGAVVSNVTLGVILGYIVGWAVLRVRAATFSSLVRQEMSYHDHPDHASGIVSSWLTTSAIAVTELVGPLLVAIVTAMTALMIAFGLSCSFSWEIATAQLVAIPICVSFTLIFAILTIDRTPTASLYSHGAVVATDAILNVRTIRALNAAEPMFQVYQDIIDKPYQKVVGQLPQMSFAVGSAISMFLWINLISFGIAAWIIDTGRIEPPESYRAQMVFAFGMQFAIRRLAIIPDIVEGKMAAFDLFSVMDRKSKIDPTVSAHPVSQAATNKTIGDGLVTFDIQNFRFDHRPEVLVLQDVNFSVKFGDNVAFVGPSGSGKSTLMQLMLRFYDPTNGGIYVGGTDLRDFDLQWWRKNIGFVGQEPVLFDMSVEENIRYGKPDASHQEVEEAARRANIEFVGKGKSIGWSDSVGLRGGQLSGGQKQRMAIARAIIRDPPFLLLDEATSSLDSQSESVVQAALDEAAKGRTTFVIAHRLSTIMGADQIFVIADGRMVENGTHNELAQSDGIYAKLLASGRN